jgi:hypothetical protein
MAEPVLANAVNATLTDGAVGVFCTLRIAGLLLADPIATVLTLWARVDAVPVDTTFA